MKSFSVAGAKGVVEILLRNRRHHATRRQPRETLLDARLNRFPFRVLLCPLNLFTHLTGFWAAIWIAESIPLQVKQASQGIGCVSSGLQQWRWVSLIYTGERVPQGRIEV